MTKVDKPVWVVLWQVWKPNDHDWIGRLKLGRRFLVDRRPLPEVQRKSFTSRKAADRFAAKLRRGNTAQIDVVTTVLDPPPALAAGALPATLTRRLATAGAESDE